MSNVKSKRGRLRSLLLCCAFCAVFLTGFVAGAGSIACYLFLQPSGVPILREANVVPADYQRDDPGQPASGAPRRDMEPARFYSVHTGAADDVIHFRSSPPPERKGPNVPERDLRHKELIYTSENFEQIKDVWERIWFLDNPDFETPDRSRGPVLR